MSIEELRQSLPPVQQKHLDPAAPPAARMMAAKGMLPLAPRETTIVLAGLALDQTAEVAEMARASLAKMPDRILVNAIDAGLPEAALTVLAPLVSAREAVIERLVLAKKTPDQAIAAIAGTVGERIAEIIAGNQERCLRSQNIVRALRENPNLLHSTRDRLFDFLVRSGVIYEDIPEFADAIARLSPAEMEAAADKVELPPEVAALMQNGPARDQRATSEEREAAESKKVHADEIGAAIAKAAGITAGEAEGRGAEPGTAEAASAIEASSAVTASGDASAAPPGAEGEEPAGASAAGSPESSTEGTAAGSSEAPDEEPKERIPMLKLIASLGVSKRVALAIKGNKEARAILLRDANRVVASAAIRNPRITEQEVIGAAQSRSVCDEVIRIIASSKELSRTYGVKVALVNNPKTPLPTAMRFLTLLRDADIRALAKSKNVSTAVVNQARRLLSQKKSGGQG